LARLKPCPDTKLGFSEGLKLCRLQKMLLVRCGDEYAGERVGVEEFFPELWD
jgi:hypothetical protein